MNDSKRQEELFKKYLSQKRILIVDPNSSTRKSTFKIICEMGAKTTLVHSCQTYQEARDYIEKSAPDVVFAEYKLDVGCGLDLLQSQREKNPDTKKSLFILITGNTSQSAVAQAAEEDIDAFILKPFNQDSMKRTVLTCALHKINPSPYVVLINEGKELLDQGKLDEARAKFEDAKGANPKPSLALFYIGQVDYVKKLLSESEGSYQTGLSFNKIHYKCLIGLYSLLMEEKKHAQAYEIVKKISQYFPANPKRLAEVLRLAIINAKYEDIEKYYSFFCNLDSRDEMLIKYVCAALVVCGKYYLKTNNRTRALELYQKAAVTSAGRINILKEIVQALIDFELYKEAETFLARTLPENQTGPEYLYLRFQLINTSGAPQKIIHEGRALIEKGIHDERIYDIILRRAVESKLKAVVETIFYDSIQRFPQNKEKYESIVKNGGLEVA